MGSDILREQYNQDPGYMAGDMESYLRERNAGSDQNGGYNPNPGAPSSIPLPEQQGDMQDQPQAPDFGQEWRGMEQQPQGPLPIAPQSPGLPLGAPQMGGGGSYLSPQLQEALKAQEGLIRQELGQNPTLRGLNQMFTQMAGRQYVPPEEKLANLAITRQKLETAEQDKQFAALHHMGQLMTAWGGLAPEDQKRWGPALEGLVARTMAGSGVQIPAGFLQAMAASPGSMVDGLGFLNSKYTPPGMKAALVAEVQAAQRKGKDVGPIIKHAEETVVNNGVDALEKQLPQGLPGLVADVKQENGLDPTQPIPEASFRALARKMPVFQDPIAAKILDKMVAQDGATSGILTNKAAEKQAEARPVKTTMNDMGIGETTAPYVQDDPTYKAAAALNPSKTPAEVLLSIPADERGKIIANAKAKYNAEIQQRGINIAVETEKAKAANLSFGETAAAHAGGAYFDKNTGTRDSGARSPRDLSTDSSKIFMDAKKVEHYNDLDRQEQYVMDWKDVAAKLPENGGVKNLMTAAVQAGKAKMGYANEYTDIGALKGRLGTMARSVGGERGVLTEGDIQRAEALFQRMGDSRAAVMARLRYMDNLIQLDRDILLQKYDRSKAREYHNKFVDRYQQSLSGPGKLGSAVGGSGGVD